MRGVPRHPVDGGIKRCSPDHDGRKMLPVELPSPAFISIGERGKNQTANIPCIENPAQAFGFPAEI